MIRVSSILLYIWYSDPRSARVDSPEKERDHPLVLSPLEAHSTISEDLDLELGEYRREVFPF